MLRYKLFPLSIQTLTFVLSLEITLYMLTTGTRERVCGWSSEVPLGFLAEPCSKPCTPPHPPPPHTPKNKHSVRDGYLYKYRCAPLYLVNVYISHSTF